MNDGSSGVPRVRPSAPAAGVLEVRGVTVRFGGLTALDDVSLTAAPRQVTGIIGPNGAGKTTLLNVLCGLVRPDSGQIWFDGSEFTRLRPHRLAGLGIARTLQGVGLFDGLTVVENVMVGATSQARAGFWSGLFGLPRSDRDERMLRRERWTRWIWSAWPSTRTACPGTLPYGVRKRIALARALVAGPRLLLLDEPASGLSESELPELGDLIEKLAADASVVVIEHRMDLMMSVCNTITVLDFGKVIAAGTAGTGAGRPGCHRGVPGRRCRGRCVPMPDAAAPGGRGRQEGLTMEGEHPRRSRSRTWWPATAVPRSWTASRSGQAGHDHRRPRRERRRQDHPAAHHHRAGPAAPRAHHRRTALNLARRPPEAVARAGVAHVPEGQGVITELTVEENLRLGALRAAAGQPGGRAGRRLSAVPDPRRAARGRGRHPVRRRAADPGHRQGADGQPRVLLLDEPSLGPGAEDRRAGHGPGPRAARRLRPDRPAGRAERAQRAEHRRPGHRAQPRQDRRRAEAADLLTDVGLRRTIWASREDAKAGRREGGRLGMQEFVEFTLGGIAVGMIYAAIALSLVLIWRGTRILNYSQGGMAMFTTYVALSRHQAHRQLLARLRRGARRRPGARRRAGADGRPAGREQAAAERRDRDHRPADPSRGPGRASSTAASSSRSRPRSRSSG